MRQRLRSFALLLLSLTALAMPLSASAAVVGYNRVYQPPAVTFIVLNASPQVSMKVQMVPRKASPFITLPRKERRLWETVFRISRPDVMGMTAWFGNSYDFQDAVMMIEDQGQSYTIPIPYQELTEAGIGDILMLDLKSGQLRVGVPGSRTLLLFFVHLMIYLLVESLILWLHGVRSKRSWIIFLIYTVLTKSIVCFLTRHWLNVDPKLYLVFAVGVLFYIVIDMAFYLLVLDSESRDKMSKFSALSNIAAGLAMYGAMVFLPM